jgi:hypothetical protein
VLAQAPQSVLIWECIFVLPPWLQVWWQEFGFISNPYLYAVKQGDSIIGITPVLFKEGEARFIGGADDCDCLNFVVSPRSTDDFFNILFDYLIL